MDAGKDTLIARGARARYSAGGYTSTEPLPLSRVDGRACFFGICIPGAFEPTRFRYVPDTFCLLQLAAASCDEKGHPS